MEGTYPIHLDQNRIGEARISRRGLYYHFVCSCSYDRQSVCRLMIRWEDKVEKLGVMVPDGERFVLQKQIPVKHFGKGSPVFFVPGERETSQKGIFIPILNDAPFEHLSKLQNAVLENRKGVIGAWIPEK